MVVSLVSRQGRQLQRYSSNGSRLVVGCIPYKLEVENSCVDDLDKAVEVLVISSQKGNGMLFPKGGWEIDETKKQAALREAVEEAGVRGNVERRLGKWKYKSRTDDKFHEGIMFPLNVTEELVHWPEMDVRKRSWVTVAEAREGCQHQWMREALERLIKRLSNSSRNSKSFSEPEAEVLLISCTQFL
ncbi:nudix hydrolase 18, mitochondrial-like [Typha latifolia]|uniref:nudix hydrolase 18, mitochondrial-like n=1 Tax=Typha latifolia TaxID=4733 RepID=UPI003C2DE691